MEKTLNASGSGFKTIYCCDPFGGKNHKVLKTLRPVQDWMCEVNRSIKRGMKICDSCRKQLLKDKNNLDSADSSFIDPNLWLQYLNKSLSSLEESPISKKRKLNGMEDKLELLKKYWCPYAIVYDPLKAGSIDGTDTEPHDKAIVRAQNVKYRPNSKVKGNPECTIFVAGLDTRTKETDLLQHFRGYGRIMNCRVVEDIVTGRSKGYAFIEFETEHAAIRAYRGGHRTRIDGREIFVDMECERLLPGWVPRRLGGGFSGKKESGQLRFGGRSRTFKKPIGLLSSDEILLEYDYKYSRNESESKKASLPSKLS